MIIAEVFFKLSLILSFIYVGNLYMQQGAGTHNRKIESCMLYPLSQPGAPIVEVFLTSLNQFAGLIDQLIL